MSTGEELTVNVIHTAGLWHGGRIGKWVGIAKGRVKGLWLANDVSAKFKVP